MSDRRRARAGLLDASVGGSKVSIVPAHILDPDHSRWHEDADDLWEYTLWNRPVPESVKAAACRLGRIRRWSDGVDAYARQQGWLRGKWDSVDDARLAAEGIPLRLVQRERLHLIIASQMFGSWS